VPRAATQITEREPRATQCRMLLLQVSRPLIVTVRVSVEAEATPVSASPSTARHNEFRAHGVLLVGPQSRVEP